MGIETSRVHHARGRCSGDVAAWGALDDTEAMQMAINVTEWLHSLGLEQYADAFSDNDLDGEVLPEVKADDLIAIGVTSIGHRRKLIAAVAAWRSEVAPTAGAGASADPIPTLSPVSTVRL